MPTYRQYLHQSPGTPLQDIWAYQPHTRGVLHGSDEAIDEDVRWLVAQGDEERQGYQTQKPQGLLRRIIESSCPPGGVVLDPFCGCGTTVIAAQELARSWIGIDITYAAIRLIKKRLLDVFGDEVSYRLLGEPKSVPDAAQLAKNPYQFQWWALDLVDARPTEERKGADRGIDGRLYFHDEGAGGKTKSIIFSVKAGQIGPEHLRELRGVIEREEAQVGVFISLETPTAAMRKEAANAGFYDSPFGSRHARIQLLTIAELLEGKKVDYPATRANVTFKRAPRPASREKQDPIDW